MAQRINHEKLNARLKAIQGAIEYHEKWGEWERVENSVEELCKLLTKSRDQATSITIRYKMMNRMLLLCQALLGSNQINRHALLVDKALDGIKKIIEEYEDWRLITARAQAIKS